MRERVLRILACTQDPILVPRGRAPFGQHQESRPLAKSNPGSPRFTDFPSLCACSESSLTNLIGSDLILLCLQSHSKTECRWTRPEVAILGADQKERGLWGREWQDPGRTQADPGQSRPQSSRYPCPAERENELVGTSCIPHVFII